MSDDRKDLKSLFRKGAPSAPATEEDAQLLRDGLVYLLEILARQLGAPERKRVALVVKRLKRFPAPPGLPNELRKFAGLFDQGELGSGAAEFSEAIRALTTAIEESSLLDEDVRKRVRRLRDQVPERVRPADADAIAHLARSLSEWVRPVRVRSIESRRAVLAANDELVGHAELARDAAERAEGLSAAIDELSKVAPAAGRAEEGLRRVATLAAAVRAELVTVREQLQETLEQAGAIDAHAAGDVHVSRQHLAGNEQLGEPELDPITGAFQRDWFLRAVPEHLGRARRSGQPACLLALDIDGLDDVNTSYGRSAGDRVLQKLVLSLGDVLRRDDVVARFEDDTFAVLLVGSSAADGAIVAERIHDLVSRTRFSDGEHSFFVTCSLGGAAYASDEGGATLVRRALDALEQVKAGGGDSVVMAE